MNSSPYYEYALQSAEKSWNEFARQERGYPELGAFFPPAPSPERPPHQSDIMQVVLEEDLMSVDDSFVDEVRFCQVCGTQETVRWRNGPDNGNLCDNDYSSYNKMLATNPEKANEQYRSHLFDLKEAQKEQQRRLAIKSQDLIFRERPFCQYCGELESPKFHKTQEVGYLCKNHYQAYGWQKRNNSPEIAKIKFAPKYFSREEAERSDLALQRQQDKQAKVAEAAIRANPFCQYCGTIESPKFHKTKEVGFLCLRDYQTYSEMRRKDAAAAAQEYAPQFFSRKEAEQAQDEQSQE